MLDETSEPKPTEKKRAGTVRDLKTKTDPKGGAGNGGKSDKWILIYNGRQHIVYSDELLNAFLEFEATRDRSRNTTSRLAAQARPPRVDR